MQRHVLGLGSNLPEEGHVVTECSGDEWVPEALWLRDMASRLLKKVSDEA